MPAKAGALLPNATLRGPLQAEPAMSRSLFLPPVLSPLGAFENSQPFLATAWIRRQGADDDNIIGSICEHRAMFRARLTPRTIKGAEHHIRLS